MSKSQINEISPKEAKEVLDQKTAVFIDIRDSDSYRESHIENSRHVTDETIKDFVSNSDKDQPVIVYCYKGISSQGAAGYLQENGFKDVKSMEGGFEAWEADYPSVAEES